ncbi:MAG: phosphoglycerate kinase, partial [Clostridia bacterium]|nr:phosphoglycerate kinase [Clostridia bacterium]
VIILSHFGKVKTEEDKLKNSLEKVALRLQELVSTKVIFSKQTRSLNLEERINNMQPGEIMVLENTRFEDVPDKLESGCDTQLSMYWASLADIYCLDAFGSAHRKHSSTFGVAKNIPNCIGFLVEREMESLDNYILNAKKPFTIVMGGAKVEDKIELIESLLPICDHLLITGGIANSCLYSIGFPVGNSLRSTDEEVINKLRDIIIANQDKISLPVDVIVGKTYDTNYVGTVNATDVSNDDCIYDIGFKTINKYKDIINNSATIFVNGTAGKYEDIKFATGTREILENIANSNAIKVVGGGDGVSAVKHFKLENNFTYTSTGGGATLQYIINGGLPAIDNI